MTTTVESTATYNALVQIAINRAMGKATIYRDVANAQGTKKGAQKLLNSLTAVKFIKKTKGIVPGVSNVKRTFKANKYV